MIGIYSIINLINGKRYVGQSIRIESRINYHFTNLRKGKHFIPHLQSSYNIYGESNFSYEILEEVSDADKLDSREIYWIRYYDTLNPKHGYNRAVGGGGSASHHVSELTRKKIAIGVSKARKGKPGTKHTDDYKLRMSLIMKGRKFSDDTKRKMSESAKSKVLSETTRKKLSEKLSGSNNPMYNVKHSLDSRMKMSESHKGLLRSDDSKHKQSIKMSGSNNPRYGIRDELHPNYNKISVTNGLVDKYINSEELSEYEKLGYHKGRSCGDSISKSKCKYVYTYDNNYYLGWRSLARVIKHETGITISQTTIERLSLNLPTRTHQELQGKISRITKEDYYNEDKKY